MNMIVYRCDADSPSGYSRAARMNIRCMLEQGLDIKIEQNKKDRTTVEFDEFWKSRYDDLLIKEPIKNCIRIWHETPDFFEPLPHTYDIGMVPWETSRIVNCQLNQNPRTNWVSQMNRMKEIWTNAESSKEAFQRSGVNVPIYVFPHPIDTKLYHKVEDEYIYDTYGKRISEDKFTMLSVFQWIKRKNPQGLLMSYLSTFDAYTDVLLSLKTYSKDLQSQDGKSLLNTIKMYRDSMKLKSPPELQGLWANIPEKDMPKMYSAYSLYVGLPYGEGFGLPFQEAMCCEVPVVYPKSSSMMDFIDDEVGYGVEVDEEPVQGMPIPWYLGDQTWWKPLHSSAKKALLQAYDDWKTGKLKEKGKKARERIVKLHSLEIVGNAFKERIKKIERNL